MGLPKLLKHESYFPPKTKKLSDEQTVSIDDEESK